jgi:hypothetical protein
VNVEVEPPRPQSAAASGDEPEALIKEARRRQRRRQLWLSAAVAILVTGALAVAGALHGARHPPPARPPVHHRTPPSGSGHVARPSAPGPIPASVDSTVLMWPVGSEQDGTIYLDNLRTGHLGWASPIVDPGEYQPIMLVGREIIYVVTRGVLATDTATDRTRVLGHTLYFAPSGRPGNIWLVYDAFARREMVRLVPVGAGQAGPLVPLPRGTQLIAGTEAGLLLAAGNGLELWNPGGTARTLPDSESAPGFTVGARLVAYDTGCASPATGTLMAAKAVIPPDGRGIIREYVLRLSGRDRRSILVPSSASFLLSATAWSAASSWLFYQGPGERMWAYQVRTGEIRSSRTPCCQYTTMATLSARSR